MAFSFDPQIEAALRLALEAFGDVAQPEAGDWRGIRRNIDSQMALLRSLSPTFPDIARTEFATMADDGAEIRLRWYAKEGQAPGSAVLFIHGGGMMCGSVDLYDGIVAAYVSASGVPMVAVEYRLAPEHPHPAPVEDSYAGLKWLIAQAAVLQVDPARIGVMGDSAGGGIAAGVALLARDRGVALAKQILIYPMLDDRNLVPDALLAPFATWSYDNNITGWQALLGGKAGTDEVSPIAAPARVENPDGVAPAYIEVGELDIFRNENIEYGRRLAAAGVSVELHVHPGAPHGFERLAPASDVARRSTTDRIRVLKAL